MARILKTLTACLLLCLSLDVFAAAFPDQGRAFAACKASEAVALAHPNVLNAHPTSCSQIAYTNIQGVTSPKYTCYVSTGAGNTYNYGCGYYGGDADSDYAWPPAKMCSMLGPLSEGWFQVGSGSTTCKDGCEYGASSGSGITSYELFPGSPEAIQFKKEQGGSSPTGATCAADNPSQGVPVTEQKCVTQGALTQCVRPDGKHCAAASNGKMFCWNPSEAGTKQDKNDAATKSPSGLPSNPPTNKPPNNGDWQQTGQGTTIVNNNGNTTNYNTSTFSSNYGSEGTGGGSTNPDGSENPGPGGGDGEGDDGHGTVGGDGQCQGTFTCSGGDPVLCAIAQQQYQARCEADGRFDGEGTFPGDGDGGAGQDPEKEDVVRDATLGLGMLDEAGLGVGGSCPDFGTLNVMGRTIEIDPDGRFCQIIGVARACLLILGAFIALGILAGRNDS